MCALIATLMLLWTSNWMLNKSSVEAWNNYIRNKTEAAVAGAQSKVESGQRLGLGMIASLAMLSFLAVFREGAERDLLRVHLHDEPRYSRYVDRWSDRRGGACRHLPALPLHLREDSDWSVLPGHFDSDVCAGGGVRRRRRPLADRGRLAARLYLNGVPTNDWLGLYPYVECLVAQAIAAVAVIALFVVGFIKQRKLKAQAAAEAPAVKA